jgi:peroxiredoxin
MKTKIIYLVIFSLVGFSFKETEVEDGVQNFSLINAIDNSTVSLNDFTKSKAVVIVFSSPSCAFSRHYDDRLINLANEFKPKDATFLLINPNNPSVSTEDNSAAMMKRAQEKNYPFPFLIDKDQQAADIFGASKTPEAFVLKYTNGSFVVRYKGAIDDNPQLASEVRASYLRDAIQSVINNSPVKISEKKATGCSIKK